MSNEIKVGDVCEIVDACCDRARRHYVGIEVVTVSEGPGTFHCTCGHEDPDFFIVQSGNLPDPNGFYNAARKFLRKKPPKSADNSEPRTEHVPAADSGWTGIGWHPSKTRETEPA